MSQAKRRKGRDVGRQRKLMRAKRSREIKFKALLLSLAIKIISV